MAVACLVLGLALIVIGALTSSASRLLWPAVALWIAAIGAAVVAVCVLFLIGWRKLRRPGRRNALIAVACIVVLVVVGAVIGSRPHYDALSDPSSSNSQLMATFESRVCDDNLKPFLSNQSRGYETYTCTSRETGLSFTVWTDANAMLADLSSSGCTDEFSLSDPMHLRGDRWMVVGSWDLLSKFPKTEATPIGCPDSGVGSPNGTTASGATTPPAIPTSPTPGTTAASSPDTGSSAIDTKQPCDAQLAEALAYYAHGSMTRDRVLAMFVPQAQQSVSDILNLIDSDPSTRAQVAAGDTSGVLGSASWASSCMNEPATNTMTPDPTTPTMSEADFALEGTFEAMLTGINSEGEMGLDPYLENPSRGDIWGVSNWSWSDPSCDIGVTATPGAQATCTASFAKDGQTYQNIFVFTMTNGTWLLSDSYTGGDD